MRKALLAAMAAVILFPTTAHAKIFEVSAADPTGDVTPAALDITAIAARYDDREGAVSITVQLAATPEGVPDGNVLAVLQDSCGDGDYVAFLDRLTPRGDDPGRYQTDSRPAKPLTRGGTPPTVTLAATDLALSYEDHRCLTVETRASTTENAPVVDSAQAMLVEVAPPPPAPTPAPTPEPVAPQPQPQPPAALGPSPLTRAEKLEAALATCANAKCKRKARKRFGPTKRERYRAALDKCKKSSCERRAKARFRGVKPAPKPTGLERKLFARSGSDLMGVCGGICWEALSFVDRRYVHVGLPEGAGVPNCRRVTYDADKQEGCTTYRVRGRTVTIAGRRYTIAKNALLTRAADGDEKQPAKLDLQVFPKAGARWDVPEIEAIRVSGSPFIGTQIITKSFLMLDRAGQFVRTSYSFGGSAPGSAVTINFATAPRDTKGTYEILPAGTIRLTFEDGRVEVGPAFFWNPAKGRDPNKAGLHAVGRTFFGPPDR